MDVGRVGQCFFPSDRRETAEVAIVFGMNDPRRPVEHAVEAFRGGLVQRLLFTGGYNERLRRTEAEVMAELACGFGVPDKAILIEDQARNTEENIVLSQRLLQDETSGSEVSSIMLLTIHYHLRRAILAARRHVPPGVELSWTSYPSAHYSSRNWYETERGCHDVLTEIGKIERYYGLALDDLLGQ